MIRTKYSLFEAQQIYGEELFYNYDRRFDWGWSKTTEKTQ